MGDISKNKTLGGHEKTVILSAELRKHVIILESALENIKRLADLWETEEERQHGDGRQY
jgi:hypothetical protein